MLLLLGLPACKLLLRNVLSRAESNSVSHSTLLGKNNIVFVELVLIIVFKVLIKKSWNHTSGVLGNIVTVPYKSYKHHDFVVILFLGYIKYCLGILMMFAQTMILYSFSFRNS